MSQYTYVQVCQGIEDLESPLPTVLFKLLHCISISITTKTSLV